MNRKNLIASSILLLLLLMLISLAQAGTSASLVEFAKSLNASNYDKQLPEVPVEKWLASVLPKDIVAIWEAEVNDCGEQTGDPAIDRNRDIPLCAGLELRKADKRVGYIMLLVGTAGKGVLKEGLGLYYGEVQLDGTMNTLKRLGELPDVFAASEDALPEPPRPPYTVEGLRQWHKGLGRWPWLGEPEQRLNLRNTKDYELLLAINGYARGGTYVLFAESGGVWSQISGQIPQAHHPPRILEGSSSGWHDFMTFVPLWGSGGKDVLVSTYGWGGEGYVLKNSEQGLWCDYEPFRLEADLCGKGHKDE